MSLYTADDYATALGLERIEARGYTPEELARYYGDSAYTSPAVLALVWDYSDAMSDAMPTLSLTLAGQAYAAVPKPEGGYRTVRFDA